MARTGRIRTRLALAFVLTALIPVLVAVVLAVTTTRNAIARLFVPEVGSWLDRSLGLYLELSRAVKQSMRNEATAIALGGPLRRAAASADRAALQHELAQALARSPGLLSLEVKEHGRVIASANRGRPLDESNERELCVMRALSEGQPEAPEANEQSDEGDECEPDPSGITTGPTLVVRLATDSTRFKELPQLSKLVRLYSALENERPAKEKQELVVFALLLGITMVAAIFVATLLARGVVSRIGALARAMQGAGAGDLDVRVHARGSDEITDLANGFNRMLGEIEASRARIEYLQRIEAWQEMARRLAHEIKNPLTPIQLAVQDIHRRYSGQDAEYTKLLDTTLEIVEDEVGTLRRLVTEFSDFARLPQAELSEADLAEFLEEQREHLALGEEEGRMEGMERDSAPLGANVRVDFQLKIDERPAPVLMDRHMFRRALINLVRNAVQAIDGAGRSEGTVRISLRRDGEHWVVDVDDNGPGIPDEMRLSAFDPYVTTKIDGAGLGLAITKKIIVEHGGSVTVDRCDLGGARVRIRLPVPGTAAARTALAARTGEPPSVRRDGLSRSAGLD